MDTPPVELSAVELEILGILWTDHPRKPAEIEEALSRRIENATLRSILVGLVEKGYLKRDRVGKAYFYRPARKASSVRRKITDSLATIFAEGSRLGLIAQLIKDEKLSADQVKELQKLADKD